MKSDNTEELRQLAALVTNRAAEEEIVQKASEIKTRLISSWQEIIKAVNVVDGLVATFASSQQWQPGLVFSSGMTINQPRMVVPIPRAPMPRITTPKAVNADVVLRIANDFATKGQVVKSKQVAARLRAEGDTRPKKSVETSVSNILARRGWRKVHPGEYALVKNEDEKSKEVK